MRHLLEVFHLEGRSLMVVRMGGWDVKEQAWQKQVWQI